MSWMLTASGQEYHLHATIYTDAMRPVCLEDVAHHLAIINRFHGATARPYSVAEHSLLVWRLARGAGLPPMGQMAALLHDAHEAYTSDLASPAKRAVDAACRTHSTPPAWAEFEAQHAHHVRQCLGITTALHAHRETIRFFDLVALYIERKYLTTYRAGHHAAWPCLGQDIVAYAEGERGQEAAQAHLPGLQWLNPPYTWAHWRQQFITTHNMLHRCARQSVGLPAQATEAA